MYVCTYVYVFLWLLVQLYIIYLHCTYILHVFIIHIPQSNDMYVGKRTRKCVTYAYSIWFVGIKFVSSNHHIMINTLNSFAIKASVESGSNDMVATKVQ